MLRHTIIPLLLCITTYILLRDKVFLIINQDHLHVLYQLVKGIQSYLMPLRALPNWVMYSLPDGLWTYAFTSYFVINFDNRPYTPKKLLYLLFCPILSISFEITQYFHLLPGTFDINDLLCYISGGTLPYFLPITQHKRLAKEGNCPGLRSFL